MTFEVPHCHTRWIDSEEYFGLALSDEVTTWLLNYKMVWTETIRTDNTRDFFTKVIFIDIEDPAYAMLFKLTWM